MAASSALQNSRALLGGQPFDGQTKRWFSPSLQVLNRAARRYLCRAIASSIAIFFVFMKS
jgi:hypothetical protein